MMRLETASVVQFPHPGPEHDPGDVARQPWNTGGAHRRKFLLSPAVTIAEDGEARPQDVAFWGEWEPPSKVEQRWPWDGDLPRFLQRPLWEVPSFDGFRQNTDPWVFGDRFLYSNCRQLTPRGGPTALQGLARGSVILFGSQLSGQFVLDTVFVVSGAVPFTVARSETLDVDEVFRSCTIDSLLSGDPTAPLTLFYGATCADPVEGMFSFAPCRPASAPNARFARPAIELPGLVNPRNARAAAGANTPLPLSACRHAWEAVRDQVFAAGCVLGTGFRTPPLEKRGPVPVQP